MYQTYDRCSCHTPSPKVHGWWLVWYIMVCPGIYVGVFWSLSSRKLVEWAFCEGAFSCPSITGVFHWTLMNYIVNNNNDKIVYSCSRSLVTNLSWIDITVVACEYFIHRYSIYYNLE